MWKQRGRFSKNLQLSFQHLLQNKTETSKGQSKEAQSSVISEWKFKKKSVCVGGLPFIILESSFIQQMKS